MQSRERFQYDTLEIKPSEVISAAEYVWREGPMMCGHCGKPVQDHKDGDDCELMKLLAHTYFRESDAKP